MPVFECTGEKFGLKGCFTTCLSNGNILSKDLSSKYIKTAFKATISLHQSRFLFFLDAICYADSKDTLFHLFDLAVDEF